MGAVNCLVTDILQNGLSFFLFTRRKKLKQVWNNMRVSSLNYDSIFIFGSDRVKPLTLCHPKQKQKNAGGHC